MSERWLDLRKGDILMEIDGNSVILVLDDPSATAKNGTRGFYLGCDLYRTRKVTWIRDDHEVIPSYWEIVRA